jgi:hypothetical protein
VHHQLEQLDEGFDPRATRAKGLDRWAPESTAREQQSLDRLFHSQPHSW